MRRTSTLVLLSGLLLGAGCAYNPPPHYATTTPVFRNDPISNPPAVAAVTPPVYTGTTASLPDADLDLTTAVRHQFDRYGDLSAIVPNLDIKAQDGTITLTGAVPGQREHDMILAMVRNTPGVVAVNDLMRIANGEAPVQPTGRVSAPSNVYAGSTDDYFNLHVQGLSDTDRNLAQQILQGLRTDTALASTVPKVNIYVANGQVTLQGIVQNEQQRQAIATTVQNAAGIGNVKNELQVQQVPR